MPHVVIVGGGFGGLNAAKALGGKPVRVTVVDQRNHHLFQPLLYQVATAALSPGDIATPIRSILRKHRNILVMLGAVVAVEPDRKRLILEEDSLEYDYLILATGSSHAYFGHPEWESLAPGLKSLEDAIGIRRRILLAYETAERNALERVRAGMDPTVDEGALTFAIVGGGPTGVELAGAIAEIARQTLTHDFRLIDPAKTRVVLLESSPRVLATYPPELSARAVAELEGLGVEVHTGSAVTNVTPDGVYVGEKLYPARTVLWAAGVASSPVGRSIGVPVDRSGRVHVEPDLSVPGHPEIFVVGDLALFMQDGKPLPGVAPVAIQEGKAAAENVLRTVQGRRRFPFHYRDRGRLAIIGRGAGVADLGIVKLSGFAAWLAWLFVHIYFLIGFENRIAVMMKWAWSYLTFQRGARLITFVTSPHAAAVGEPDGRTRKSEASEQREEAVAAGR